MKLHPRPQSTRRAGPTVLLATASLLLGGCSMLSPGTPAAAPSATATESAGPSVPVSQAPAASTTPSGVDGWVTYVDSGTGYTFRLPVKPTGNTFYGFTGTNLEERGSTYDISWALLNHSLLIVLRVIPYSNAGSECPVGATEVDGFRRGLEKMGLVRTAWHSTSAGPDPTRPTTGWLSAYDPLVHQADDYYVMADPGSGFGMLLIAQAQTDKGLTSEQKSAVRAFAQQVYGQIQLPGGSVFQPCDPLKNGPSGGGAGSGTAGS